MVHRLPPHLDHPIHPTNLIAALVDELADSGVAVVLALQGSGIAPDKLQAPDTRITYRQILAVFGNAVRLAPDPGLLLRAGQRLHFAAYGVVGYSVLSSPTHAASAELAIRYSRLVGQLVDVDFLQEDNTAIWLYAPIFWRDPAEPLYRAALEFHLASHVTVCKNLYGPGFRLTELRTQFPEPAHAQLYEDVFQCPVRFGQTGNELRYSAHRMDEPMTYANAVTHASVSEMCEQHLAQVRGSSGLGADIHRILVQHPGRFPDVEAMAAELSLSARSLRRRLEAEGTSYRQILASVREHLALAYLRKTTMTHEEIAAQLGYSDAANFRHAFIRWTGRNPSDFRGR